MNRLAAVCRPLRHARLAIMSGIATVAACNQAHDAPRDPIVRDSAGVQIVENFAAPVPRWEISSSPVLEIGSATDTATSLYQVEGAHRLSDGRVVIANRGSDELRFYGPDGTFLHAAGRKGQGPGEFDYIAWTARCGTDTIYAYDIVTQRLTVLDDHGGTVRLARLMLPNNTLPYGPSHCQPGGPFISAGWATANPEPRRHRHPMPVGLATLDGEPLAMIGEFPGVDRWGYVIEGRLRGSGPLPLGRSLVQTIVNDRVFVGTGDAYEIAVYRIDSSLEMLIRLAVAERPVTAADIDAYIEEQLRGVDDAARRDRSRQGFLEIEFPTRMPPYAAFVVDASGFLWIQDFSRASRRTRDLAPFFVGRTLRWLRHSAGVIESV